MRSLLPTCCLVLALGCGTTKPAAPGPERPSLAASVQSLFPEPGSSSVCSDAVLVLSFAESVSVGMAGSIRVFRSSDSSAPVDSIDIAAPNYVDVIGARQFYTVRPIFVRDNRVSIHLHTGVLEPDTAYFVEIDPGVLLDAAG